VRRSDDGGTEMSMKKAIEMIATSEVKGV